MELFGWLKMQAVFSLSLKGIDELKLAQNMPVAVWRMGNVEPQNSVMNKRFATMRNVLLAIIIIVIDEKPYSNL